MNAMNSFLDSYELGKISKKYIPTSVLDLPFDDNEFDISLSSHFLFLYTDNLPYEFHLHAIREMLRVSREIRIFPLLDFNANKSKYVQRIISDFKDNKPEISRVDYEFQIGGNKLLTMKSWN